jgi:hypothetical protein
MRHLPFSSQRRSDASPTVRNPISAFCFLNSCFVFEVSAFCFLNFCFSPASLTSASAAEYLTPGDVVVPPETASQEALNQSAAKTSLRFAGLDLFPHAAATAMFDDNLLISHTNALSDVEWTLSPGLTIVAGDVSSYLPGAVTLGQIRGLLNYSPVEDSSKPQRFLAVDYTPAANFFTDHSQYDNVDQTAGLSADYAFSRLALGLDQDFSRVAVKDNEVGRRIIEAIYNTKLRSRYDLTDRSSLEINGQYYRLEYPDTPFEGYQEFRNEDWFDRQVGARLNAGLGAAFGFVSPDVSPSQTYQQALVRGIYQLTGKLDLRTSIGVEWRQYGRGQAGTLDPVFSLSAVFHPRETTILTLEGHRREQPDYTGFYNYQIIGFSAGVRQQILGRFYAGLLAGYDHVDYTLLQPGTSNNRSDNYFSVRASLDYELNPRWVATLFYVRRQEDSTIQAYTYANNMVGLQVFWHL